MAISLPRQWNVSLWVLTVIGVGMAVIPLVGIGYLLLNPPPDPFGMPTPAVGELLGESGLWALLRNSLALATIVASLSVLIGGWLAWVENRYEHWCQPALLRLCLLPLAIPSYISAATLVSAFGPQGWIGSWLSLDKPEGFLAATVSLTLTCTPLTQLTLRAALSRTSVAEEEAARSLGASALKRFKVALWPQLRPAIAFSGLISFLYTISDFGAVATLNLPVLTWRLYESVRTQDLARAALLGAFTLMATVPVLIAAQRIRGSDAAAPLRNRRAARKQALPLRLLFPTLTLQLLVIGIGLIIPLQELSSWVLDGMQREQSFVSQWVALKDSLWLACVGALLTTLLALAPAWHSTHRTGSLSSVIRQSTYIASALPGVLLAFGLMCVALMISKKTGGYGLMLSSGVLLWVGYATRFLAEAFGPIQASLHQYPTDHVEIARSLNRFPGAWLRSSLLPHLRPALVTSLLISALAILKELPITLLLGGATGRRTLAFRTWDRYNEAMWHDAGVSGLILVLGSLVLTLILLRRAEDT